MKNLNKEGLTESEKKEIETKIEEDKKNLNLLLKEESMEKLKDKEEKKQSY